MQALKNDSMNFVTKVGNLFLLRQITQENTLFYFRKLINTRIISYGQEKALCVEDGSGDPKGD